MYVFEMGKLKTGDIILTTQIGAVSKAVRLATVSKFSHAILYVGNGSFIHSDGQGVHSNNIQRLLFGKVEHTEVRRLVDNSYVEKACTFARSQIGKLYSIKEAISTKNPLSKKQKMNRQFCSRLVAQAYQYSGIELVVNIDYCTPKDLQKSKFTEIVLGCLREAEDHEIQFANSPSPLQRQTEITNTILASVRKLTSSDIQSFEDLGQFIIDHPSYDIAITGIVMSSGYLNMFDYELTQNPWRYDGKLFLSVDLDRSCKREAAAFELESASNQVKLYSHNYQRCRDIRGHIALKYIEMQMELYKKLINQMNNRIEAAKYVIKNT